MTRITATEAARNFSDILNRAQYRGESFEVVRGGEVLARIVPAQRKRVTVGEFRELWAGRKRLDPEDAIQFEKDFAEIRASAPAAPYKWD
ncbi:MAG: type II toxin-antitoxin system prevent-host-death family antitoxin [Rhizobiales bacterium]|nr:type II toxin-antitoxin system prevent-host-death family antitoxin [Hyphomicrobiales bacterium]MBI3672053.1 type II toxin-antitoxin system prevent-host-death family antitoxin [Hyphomicrobiales bacterium]